MDKRTDGAQSLQVPPLSIAGLMRWVLYAIPPGGAMNAALENNLMLFTRQADPNNIRHVRDLTLFMFWDLPVVSYGSVEVLENWRGLRSEDRQSHLSGRQWDPLLHLDDETAWAVVKLLGENATNDLISLTSPLVESRIIHLRSSRPEGSVSPSEC